MTYKSIVGPENCSNIRSSIWKLSIPVVIGMIIQTFMGIVDIFFVNRLGVDQSAAVVISDSIFGVLFVFSSLVSIGAISVISRYVGMGDTKGLKLISAQSIYFTTVLGISITLLSIIGLDYVLGLFSLTENVIYYVNQYLVLRLIGLSFFFLNDTLRSLMHALGDSFTPMKVLIMTNLLNIVLTPVLIFGFGIIPGLGIIGAALATVIASFTGVILLFNRYMRSFGISGFSHFMGLFSLKMIYFKEIINIGVFSTVSNITRPLTGMIMFKIAALHSTQAVAAFGNGGRLIGLIFIILQGLQVACSVLVGQFTGAKDTGAVRTVVKESLKIALFNVFAFGIIFFIFPRQLLWLFIQDAEVVAIGVNYLRIVYAGVIFCAFTVIFGGYFIGTGFTKPSMIASLVANYVVKLPFAYILIIMLQLGLNWLWYAISFSIVAEAMILYGWYRGRIHGDVSFDTSGDD